MRSKRDIKNLTASCHSVPLKTPKTKLEVIPPKDVEGDRCPTKLHKKNVLVSLGWSLDASLIF